MRAESVVETFFVASAVERKGIYYQIARYNLVFDQISWSS
jgi:hypothetical protein